MRILYIIHSILKKQLDKKIINKCQFRRFFESHKVFYLLKDYFLTLNTKETHIVRWRVFAFNCAIFNIYAIGRVFFIPDSAPVY